MNLQRVHDLVRSQGPTLVARWTLAVKGLTGRPPGTPPVLLGHVPDLVARLADALEEPTGQDLEAFRRMAAAHAEQRLQNDFGLPVVLTEYRVLRSVIVELLARETRLEEPGPAVARVDEALDLAVGVAAERYLIEAQTWRRRFEAAARSANQVLYDWDPATDRVVWAGPTESVMGYTLEELGTSLEWFVELLHPEDRSRIRAGLEQPAARPGEYRVRRRDGEYRLLAASAHPLAATAGRGVRCVGFFTDVGAQKEAAAAVQRDLSGLREEAVARELTTSGLRRSMSERDGFLSAAAHELRTPLSTLLLESDGLVRRLSEPGTPTVATAPLLRRARKVNAQAMRMDRVIVTMLDVFELEGQRLEPAPEPSDLAELARAVVDRVRAGSKLASSTLGLRAEPVIGRWHRAPLDRLLTQLIENALKFGSRNPVEVVVEAEGDRARMVVKDQGIGISPEDQARVFGRFERAASSDDTGGFGLGLWIVRELVESMGGTVRVASRLSEGSTFVVELPRPT